MGKVRLYIEMIAYNAGPLITAAIESTYPYAEQIIVVDGSAYGPSTDETAFRAKSFGGKVLYISGTFADQDGVWDEKSQRKVALAAQPLSVENWSLAQDADEVWKPDDLERLIGHLESAPLDDCYCAFRTTHFWKDPFHVITGEFWKKCRPQMVSRLGPANPAIDLDLRPYFEDVNFYHYGPAMPMERLIWRAREYFRRGDYKALGFKTWEEFLDYHQGYGWLGMENSPGTQITPFTGTHPGPVRKISQEVWGVDL